MICDYYCSCCLFTTTEFLKEHWLSETSHTHLQYTLKIREEIESKRDALGFHGIQLFERLSVGVPAPKRMSAPGFARSNKEERPNNFGHKHRRKQLNYSNIDANFLLFSVSYLRRLGTNGHKCRCNWKYLPTIETGNTKARILVSGHFEDTYWRGTHAYSEFFRRASLYRNPLNPWLDVQVYTYCTNGETQPGTMPILAFHEQIINISHVPRSIYICPRLHMWRFSVLKLVASYAIGCS